MLTLFVPHFEDEAPLRPLVLSLACVVLDIRDILTELLVNLLVEPCHDVAELWHKIRLSAALCKIGRRRRLCWLGLLFATAEEERSRGFLPHDDELAELAESCLAKFHAVVCCKQSSLTVDLHVCLRTTA